MTMPYAVNSFEPELIAEMRGWVSDCVWDDLEDVDSLTTLQIIDGVRRHYDGGVAQFESDFYQYGPEPYYA